MAPHSSTLAWKLPWTEEPGRLQSMGSQRVRNNWATSLSLSCIGEGNGNPLQCSCLENPRNGGAWWAPIYGVAQSQTRLKRLSSSMVPYNNHWFKAYAISWRIPPYPWRMSSLSCTSGKPSGDHSITLSERQLLNVMVWLGPVDFTVMCLNHASFAIKWVPQ